MRRSIILAAICGAVAIVCLASAALFFVERPTRISVAIPAASKADINLLTAAGKVVRRGHQPIRFKIVTVGSPQEAAAKLDAGTVDMAVVRTDGTMPAMGQTVVILHRDAAVLAVPGESEIKAVGDLANHTIGIVEHDASNEALLEAVLSQSDVARDSVKIVPLTPEGVGSALTAQKVDAVLMVGDLSGPHVQSVVKAIAKATGKPPSFIDIPESAAIAQRSPAYETFKIVQGAFRGTPPQPDDELDTLSVTHRLVASSAMSNSVVADVTRFFLSERQAIEAVDPMARRIEAPSTDKGSALPAHPGTAAYIDDEEETFLDQYSDFIYLGAMFFGVLASGATAVFSRINASGARAVETLTARLIEILRLVRYAPTADLLNALEAETDDIVAAALDLDVARGMDERLLGTLGLALDQVREAIRDRRDRLGRLNLDHPADPRGSLRVIQAE